MARCSEFASSWSCSKFEHHAEGRKTLNFQYLHIAHVLEILWRLRLHAGCFFHQASTRTACCSCRNSLCSIPRCPRDKPGPHTCSASQQPVPYKCTDSTKCAWAKPNIWMQHLYHVKARNARVSACHRQDFRTQDHTISNKS